MIINENDENQDLQRDNLLPFKGFRVGYLSVGCTLHPKNKCPWVPFWSEYHFIAHLCHVKSQSIHPVPNKQRK